MRLRVLLPILALWLCALAIGAAPAQAEDAALAGRVSSIEEGAMEGVLVSARRAGSALTVTVVSDAAGLYRFPAARLAPGRYTIAIRAVGYDLDGEFTAEVAPAKTATLDLRLRPARNLAGELTNAEWLLSIPGTEAQKKQLLDCMSCHTLERIVRSQHDADEFVPLLQRMADYANMSTPLHPQRRVVAREVAPERFRKFATYLATINLSEAPQWDYALKTLARPQGLATHVVITEYAMPRATIEPHDLRMDASGMVWFSDFGEPYLSRLDPRTGAVEEFAIPELKPGFPQGSLDLEPDQDGNFWLALMYQGGLARFDVRTHQFQLFPLPPELSDDAAQQSMVMPWQSRIDGKVWTNLVARQSILRLDLASGRFELFDPFKDLPNRASHSPYGLAADAHNDLYFMDFGDEAIGRVDAATGAVALYPTPTPHSRPRRGMMDAQGRLWFAEYEGNKLAMFDTKAERFREWEAPLAWMSPYDVVLDRNGELWSASQVNDRVLRLDPRTGTSTLYLLPRESNIRKVFVDNTTTPVTFWAGNNHGASIIKLEPEE
jgi:virginiamycin B lyase